LLEEEEEHGEEGDVAEETAATGKVALDWITATGSLLDEATLETTERGWSRNLMVYERIARMMADCRLDGTFLKF
jgi:hypothetical protein